MYVRPVWVEGDIVQLPLIHLNGTSQETLFENNVAVLTPLMKAMDALNEARPHPRDYYPMGEEAFEKANDAWKRRYFSLEAVYKEIEKIAVGIQAGGSSAL